MAADLPPLLARIASVAGQEAALAIAKVRGGTEVYIPPVPGLDHWLTRLIGREAAHAVAEELTCGLAGIRVEIPLGPVGHQARQRAIVDEMLAEGRSERDIALATGYTIRGIRMRRTRQPRRDADNRQMNLF